MSNIKGIYKNIDLQSILSMLKNIQNNRYEKINIEYIKENGEHYIYKTNNELTIVLNKNLIADEEKKIFVEIQNIVEEYNKSNKKKITVDSIYDDGMYSQKSYDTNINEYLKYPNKVNLFKESLKCNIEPKKEENIQKREDKTKKIKRNFKNVAKTLKGGFKYILNKYNIINQTTKKRVLAIILSATALFSAGSIGNNIGKGAGYFEANPYGYESMDDAINGIREKILDEAEKNISNDLEREVELKVEKVKTMDGTFIKTEVIDDKHYTNYDVPNELRGILKPIATEGSDVPTLFKEIQIARLLKAEKELKKYFKENNVVKKNCSLSGNKLGQERNPDLDK